MKPKISIICPIYNAEKYIERCVNSVLNQTFLDWELLLIDDGSTDKSPYLCNEYIEKDSRIKCIHKVNGGVGSARQLGFENAIGDYIIHLDPDDWLELSALELMYSATNSGVYDMVIFDFIYNYPNKEKIVAQRPQKEDECKSIIKDILEHRLHGSCCNKLTRRTSCIESGAYFIKGLNYCEDVIFNIMVLENDIKIKYLNQPLYHYDQKANESSLTRTIDYDTFLQKKLYFETLNDIYSIDSATSNMMKGELKKMALVNDFLDRNQMRNFYPECMLVKSRFILDTLFYYLGFIGFTRLVKPYFKIRSKILS